MVLLGLLQDKELIVMAYLLNVLLVATKKQSNIDTSLVNKGQEVLTILYST